MSIKDMITPFLIHITLIPALILCYAPAQNYFRFKKRVTYTVMLLLVLVATLGISLGMAYFSLPNYFY